MQKTGVSIECKAKGNFGLSSIHGMIVAEQIYQMDESVWSSELFEKPSPDWIPPDERVETNQQSPKPAPQPSDPSGTVSKKNEKGGTE